MPSARGAPVKPTYSRWRSRACTAGVHGPALRRTVSPTRTTVLVFPPSSGISCCVTRCLSPRTCPSDPGGPVSPGVVRLRVGSKQRRNEGLRFEWGQVVRTLAEADQLDRDAELALYRDHDAALGGAVQFCQ